MLLRRPVRDMFFEVISGLVKIFKKFYVKKYILNFRKKVEARRRLTLKKVAAENSVYIFNLELFKYFN